MKQLDIKALIENLSKLDPAVIEAIVFHLENSIGIGGGADVTDSGEITVVNLLNSLGAEDLVIFDVGANKGQFSQLLIDNLQTGINFQIHAFEPSTDAFAAFHQRHGANDRIHGNNFALSLKKGEATLYADKKASGLASLTKRRLDHFSVAHGALQEKVRLETLDDYCAENNFARIDLLKIDVEGHELDVLKGAKRVLDQQAVRYITFEFGGCNIDTRTFFQDFYYFFKPIGYHMYRILPSRRLYRIGNYSETLEKFRTANYLVSREEV